MAKAPGHASNLRYDDPILRMTFARLVTHYWRHSAWLEDEILLLELHRLSGITGVLAHGRLDISGPPDIAWLSAQEWPGCELTVLDDAGHGSDNPGMTEVFIRANDRFASQS